MASHNCGDGSSSQKRPLDDETPQAKRVRTIASSSGLSHNSAYEHTHPPSSVSQRSAATRLSLKKQLRYLQLNPHGLDVRELAAPGNEIPEALEIMLDRIAAFSDGRGIVPPDWQGVLEEVAAVDRRFRWALRDNVHLSDDPAMVVECTPSPEDVQGAVDAAVECSTRGHPEANWNMNVHAQILQIAFQPRGKPKYTHFVNFMGCTTASILPDYVIPTLSKKIDFCVYLDPKYDNSAGSFQSAAARARNALPHSIVGFTDFAPLYDRFIAVSIETKNPSETFEAARLQLGVWEMARWAFLRRLAAAASITMDLPLFLPGIVIQGDDWWLVITTAEGDRTVLWQKILIGSTSNPRGVYQIVAALQYLGRWARDVHWPWLQTTVEAISTEPRPCSPGPSII